MASSTGNVGPDPGRFARRDWAGVAYPLLLLVLCLVLYLWRLGAAPLEDFDEAYYAEGAREMLARGDLLTPYFNGQPFLLKPILIYWFIAAAFRLFGPTEFAARLGSAFLGTGVVLLTYWFGLRTLTRRAALFAGLSLALCYMWIDIARDASIDIPLTAALTAALFLFYLGLRSPAPSDRSLLLALPLLAPYPLFGLALLAKGPVPTGVVAIGLLCYLLAAGRTRQALKSGHVLPGLALMLLVAAPWYAYELAHQPAFFSTFFIREHFGHIGGELARSAPVWANLWYLLTYFSPWVAFLPAALAHAFRQQDRSHPLRLAAWWTLAVVVLFSIPKSKLAHYLAPAFPAMALLVGAWLDAWIEKRDQSRGWAIAAFFLLGLVGAACAAGAALAALQPDFVKQPLARVCGPWTPGLAPALMLSALALGSLVSLVAWRQNRALVAPALAAAMLIAGLLHVGWFKLRLAQIQAQPRKELALFAARSLPHDAPLGVYNAKRNSTIFYLGRPIVDLGEREDEWPAVERFLSAPGPRALLTHRRFLPRLARLAGAPSVLSREGEYILLVSSE